MIQYMENLLLILFLHLLFLMVVLLVLAVEAVVVEVDKEMRVPGYESWRDVPVSEVSEIASIREARAQYEVAVKKERRHEIEAPASCVEADAAKP